MNTKTDIHTDKNKVAGFNFSENMTYPDFKNTNKTEAVSKWLINWIEEGLQNGSIKPNYLLPSKAEMAYTLGVSIGTIQNAIRYVEDLGYLESKQCIGTIIKGKGNSQNIRKLTSKREMAFEMIKKHIAESKYKIGSILPSIRAFAKITNVSLNTIRLALNTITTSGIAEYTDKHELMLKSLDFTYNEKTQQTLVLKIKEDLKNYIKAELETGDKIAPHEELAEKFHVSIKTIHDAIKSLCYDGILISRRGKYGTSVVRKPSNADIVVKPEMSIFASAEQTAFYFYEKTQNKIKQMIINNYEIGSKLPSIKEMSEILDVSPNIVRKALNNLANDGCLKFSRGRYGGTFVVDIPETDEVPYKWLAINTDNITN